MVERLSHDYCDSNPSSFPGVAGPFKSTESASAELLPFLVYEPLFVWDLNRMSEPPIGLMDVDSSGGGNGFHTTADLGTGFHHGRVANLAAWADVSIEPIPETTAKGGTY